MYHFCTYFDIHYLLRGMTLYRSMTRHCQKFILYVLCLDDQTFSILSQLNLEKIKLITLNEIEQWETRLKAAKRNRSRIEYYFTLSPILPLYLISHYSDIDVITYLDSDIFFYSGPEPVYNELDNQSILIVEHRFPEHLKHRLVMGRFNVQYLSFRNDAHGITCLKRWLDQCINWCHDYPEKGRFADQKYLDEWPDLYNRLVILKHKGAGLAPWNWSNYHIEINRGQILVDNQLLVFYHFHGIKILNRYFISIGMARYDKIPVKLRKWLYGGYINELKNTENWIKQQGHSKIKISYSDIRQGYSLFYAMIAGLISGQLMKV